VLAQHLDYTTSCGQVATVFVVVEVFSNPLLSRYFVDGVQLVRLRLVGAEKPESRHVLFDNVSKIGSKYVHAWSHLGTGLLDSVCILLEVGHGERLVKDTAVCDRVRRHATSAFGGQSSELWN